MLSLIIILTLTLLLPIAVRWSCYVHFYDIAIRAIVTDNSNHCYFLFSCLLSVYRSLSYSEWVFLTLRNKLTYSCFSIKSSIHASSRVPGQLVTYDELT